MAEHRGGIVEIGGREDECRRHGVDGIRPGLERRARLQRQAAAIECQAFVQPAIARDEGTLRMLFGFIRGWRLEEGAKRRFQLGPSVGLAIGSQKETGTVDQAVMPGAKPVRTVVKESLPSWIGCKIKRLGAGDQSLEIALIGGFGIFGYRKRKRQKYDKSTER